MKTFYCGGTLGDSFIIACKLYDYHKKTGEDIILYRYTSNPELDGVVKSMFELFPYVHETPVHCNGMEDEINSLKEASEQFEIISSLWTAPIKKSFNNWYEKDPKYIRMEPFPYLDIKPVKSNKKRIGFQIQSGKLGGNFKGLSIRWIKQIISFMKKNMDHEIILLGKSFNNEEELLRLERKFGVINYVDTTSFKEWISILSGLDYLITPEGFPAFFAMSQRVKTLAFYTNYNILSWVHPDWRKTNILMCAGWKDLPSRFYNRIHRVVTGSYPSMAPLKPEQVYSLIHSELSYLEQTKIP